MKKIVVFCLLTTLSLRVLPATAASYSPEDTVAHFVTDVKRAFEQRPDDQDFYHFVKNSMRYAWLEFDAWLPGEQGSPHLRPFLLPSSNNARMEGFKQELCTWIREFDRAQYRPLTGPILIFSRQPEAPLQTAFGLLECFLNSQAALSASVAQTLAERNAKPSTPQLDDAEDSD